MISEGTAPMMSGMTDEQWGMQTRMMVGMWVEKEDCAKAIGDMCLAAARNAVRYMLEPMCADVTDELPKITIPFLAISAVPPEERQGQSNKQLIRQVWKDLLKGQPKITLVYFENTHHFVMEDVPAGTGQGGRGLPGRAEGRGKRARERRRSPSPRTRPRNSGRIPGPVEFGMRRALSGPPRQLRVL